MALGTREALMRTAEGLMRTKGYAAFSYADLAKAVGISKASIHHHFPAKEDLGVAIVEAYIDRVRGDFDRIEAHSDSSVARLVAFSGLFRAGTTEEFLPLCGALAAEISALPLNLQVITRHFFDVQLTWLTMIIERGIDRGEIPRGAGGRRKAFVLLGVLEGASFINWAMREGSLIDDTVIRLIAEGL